MVPCVHLDRTHDDGVTPRTTGPHPFKQPQPAHRGHRSCPGGRDGTIVRCWCRGVLIVWPAGSCAWRSGLSTSLRSSPLRSRSLEVELFGSGEIYPALRRHRNELLWGPTHHFVLASRSGWCSA